MYYKLNVPFVEKDEAKRYGAKFNFTEKYWYFEGDSLPDALMKWYPDADMVSSNTSSLDQYKNVLDDYSKYKTVSQVNDMISNAFRDTPEFLHVFVVGEVTNYNGNAGNTFYFAIKDAYSLLPCIMFKGEAAINKDFVLKKGMQVALKGYIEYYAATGKSQLRVLKIIEVGEGEANIAFLKLKEKLKAEGIFDLDHKKQIPKHATRVGIVTSKDGQAIKDICEVSKRRNPYVQLILYHVNVQGRNAVETVVAGIKYLDDLNLDVIIVGRGGGSDEELKAYNEEAIARTVYAANTPIVSAVGHEGHWTLIDDAADERAATPSEAAEKVCPDVMSDIKRVNNLKAEMTRTMFSKLDFLMSKVKNLSISLESNSPERKLKEKKDNLLRSCEKLNDNILSILDFKKHRFAVALERLNGLSPTAKLINGFGYVSKGNEPLRFVKDANIGDDVLITMSDGVINATVNEVNISKIGE